MSVHAKRTPPELGVVEWLRIGEHARAERVIADLKSLGVRHFRTHFSWADWHAPKGRQWYDWLLPRLAAEFDVLPCFTYTPPSLGIAAKTSSPPRDPQAYADFLDVIISRLGDSFEWVELWNEPNNLNDWDWHLDHNWHIFTDMIGRAAYWARERGKKTVLGGMCPTDPNWLSMLGDRGLFRYIDAIGIHGFPGTWEFHNRSWAEVVASVRSVLRRHDSEQTDVWITEAGYSTWRHDELSQLQQLAALLDAPVGRAYWYSAHDLHADESHQEGFHEDERHYHFGLKYADGREKLLYRLWAAEGLDGVRDLIRLHQGCGAGLNRVPTSRSVRPLATNRVLITGGAGFIGTNVAARLLENGRQVLILDNLSRPGVERNLRWLRDAYGDRLQVEVADVRDQHLLQDAVSGVQQIFHFAAQVAVTTSTQDPVVDFEVNLRGTLNLLEAMRRSKHPPSLVFTSTNKVYGALEALGTGADATRYYPLDATLLENGLSEAQPLEFCSPYGCSKGGADQYVLDFARTYSLPAIVLRMSCIYGPHQFGTEDQGWIAHFLIRTLGQEAITLYGDGKQVRDILYVDDLVDAMLLCQTHMPRLSGRAFNIGGGTANTISLLELLALIRKLHGKTPQILHAPWRAGDQRYYVSDIRSFSKATGWAPRTPVHEGVRKLYRWLSQNAPQESSVASLGVTAA